MSVKTWKKPRKTIGFEENKTILAAVGSSLVICGTQGKGDVPLASCLGSDHFTLATNSLNIHVNSFVAMAKRVARPMKTKKKAMKAKKGPMKSMKVVKTPLGQASSLPGPLWNAWRKHVLEHSSWLYVAVTLTHMLCCRITEVLLLQRRHFDFKRKHVTIPKLKRQPEAPVVKMKVCGCKIFTPSTF